MSAYMHVAKRHKLTDPTPLTMRVNLVIVEATELYNKYYIHYTEGSSARIKTHLDNETQLIITPPPPGSMQTGHHFTQDMISAKIHPATATTQFLNLKKSFGSSQSVNIRCKRSLPAHQEALLHHGHRM